MALTYPLNLLDDFPGWSTSFELMYRQEQSRHASGRTRVKDFGTPIWTATFVSKNLRPNQLDYWRARLSALDNGMNTFVAYPMSRCWPIQHPNGIGIGAITNTVLVNATSIPNNTIGLKNADGLKLSVGDFISVENILYQLMENKNASSGGIVTVTEVRPALSLTTNSDDNVKIFKPSCLMTLVPGSVSTASSLNGRGSISFQGVESRG